MCLQIIPERIKTVGFSNLSDNDVSSTVDAVNDKSNVMTWSSRCLWCHLCIRRDGYVVLTVISVLELMRVRVLKFAARLSDSVRTWRRRRVKVTFSATSRFSETGTALNMRHVA